MGKFNELPIIARLGIMAVIGAVIFAAAWYGPVPGFAAMKAANQASLEKLKAQEADNARLKPYESQLKQIEIQIDSLERQMERQKQIVPDQRDADDFIRDLQADAQQAGIEIRSYVAKPISQKQFYSEVPFDIELDGTYLSMLQFFEKVGSMERIVNIEGLKMSGINSKAGSVVKHRYQYSPGETVTVACTAKTFYSQTASAAAAAPGPAKPVKQ